ncbi:MAG: hypothetical protein KGZ25_09375, partial [Planctomycetes bacterium]|nr:hypothetical protein [Planctomycetota bacterium]
MCKRYLSPTIVFLVACVALSPAEAGAPKPFKVDGHTYVPVGKHGGGAYTIRLSLAPPKGQKKLKGFGILFAGNRSGEGYWLSATEKEWELLRRKGSARDKIAAGKTNSILAGKRVEVRIKKHPWLLAIAFNGRVVCEVPVDSQSGGLVAVDASRSSPASPPLIQDLSELNFSEQFMRAEDELDLKKSKVWKIHAGKWQIHSVRENVEILNVEKLPEGRKPQINRSPNPFSVSGFAKKTGLIHTGKWFWDDYKVSISVRNRGADAIGLAFNISDPKNYFLLRWENNSGYFKPTPMELVEVKNGKNAVIHEVWVNGQRDEWFNLAVRTCGTRVQVFLDEAEIMDLRNDRIIGGGIGLYVEGGSEKSMAYFDDVRARTLKRIDFTDPQLIDNWPVERSGKWEPKSVDRQRRPSQVAPRLKSKNGVLVFGTKAWPAPVIQAKIPVPNGSQKTGFLLGADHAGNGRFRVTVGRVGKNLSLAIEDQSGGKTKKLAFCEDIPVSDRKRVTLEVDATREGEINVCLDDTLQLRTVRAVPAGGKAGIFAQNAKGVSFEGLRVLFAREEDKERLPAEETFKDDPYMKHWSSAQGSWWPAGEGEEGFWHVGDFYGRSDVEIPLKEGVIFVYAAKEISRVGGYALVQKRMTANDSAFYRLTLLRKGQKVAEADVKSDKAPDGKIVFHKHDRYLWVTVGTKQLFCFRDPDPLPETKVAVSGISADDLAALEIHRYQVRDEYFEQATSDWLTVGRWDVTTRFTCDPRWSHMACMTDAAGVLMSKFEYEGDLTVEAFMGMRMHPGGPHYPRVGDLNLAFARNIRELSSGYSFVVAGWDEFWSERATYLMKGTTQLAYCGERLLPAMRRPGERKRVINVPWIRGGRDVHGAWYYVKARKQRGELDFYVDNHQAYRFHDPQPIEKVRPAVWTYNAWIVVARIKISYQRRVIPGRLIAPPQQQKSTGLPAGCKLVSETHPGFSEGFEGKDSVWQTSDKEQGGQPEIVPRGENAGNCLRVTNISTGGSSGVDAPVKDHKIDARLVHKLQFDYRMSRHSKINLYLDIGGRRYFVGMTGPEESDTKLHRLGFIDAETDGKWHSATFELGAVYRDALKNSSEEPESHKIQKLAFGNLHPGLLAGGVGGNPMGARYFLDNFAIRSVGGSHFTAKLSNEKKPDSQILAVVDQKPDTVPARPGSLDQKELASGLWYCHTRIKPAKGRASAVQHFPFLVTPARISLKPVFL